MNVSILLINYNSIEDLRNCINSFKKDAAVLPEYEILIWDNASQDRAALAEFESPDTRIFFSDENLGFGKANNALAMHAKGDALLCLNPDTLLAASTIRALVSHLSDNVNTGAAAPRLKNPDGSRQFSWNLHMGILWEFAEFLYLQNLWRSFFEKRVASKAQGTSWSVDFSSAACLCIRRNAWESVSGFDPDFFLNHEDIDICRRIRNAGWSIDVLPDIWITHLDSGTQKKNWARFIENLTVAKSVYIRKRFQPGFRRTTAQVLWHLKILSRIALCFLFAKGAARSRIPGYWRAWKHS